VDTQALMDLPGIPILLFETELIASHIKHRSPTSPPDPVFLPEDNPSQELNDENHHVDHQEYFPPNSYSADSPFEDLSAYQFSFFVTTILTRLVIQGHTKFGLRALKRLIVMGSNKWVRDSVGSPLSMAIVIVSGYGGGLWGLPKMPALRHLFVHYGGLRCVALDCKDDVAFQPYCVEILNETSLLEWKKQSQNILEIVLSNFVVPSLKHQKKGIEDAFNSDVERKAIRIFGRIYSIPQVRDESFEQWSKHTDKEDFSNFCRFILTRSKQLLKNEQLYINLSDQEKGEQLAQMYLSTTKHET